KDTRIAGRFRVPPATQGDTVKTAIILAIHGAKREAGLVVAVGEIEIHADKVKSLDAIPAQTQAHAGRRTPAVRVPIAHEHTIDRQQRSLAGCLEQWLVELIQINGHRIAKSRLPGNDFQEIAMVRDVLLKAFRHDKQDTDAWHGFGKK